MFRLLTNSDERQKMCSIFFFLSTFGSSQNYLQRSYRDQRKKEIPKKDAAVLDY